MPQEAFGIFDQLGAATAPKSAFDIFDKIAPSAVPSRDEMEKNAPGVPRPDLPEALKSDKQLAEESTPFRNPRTGIVSHGTPMGQSVLDFPYKAAKHAVEGVEALAQPAEEAGKQIAAGTAPTDLTLTDEGASGVARGATHLVQAGLEASTPLVAAGGITAPLHTAAALAAGAIADKATSAGLKHFGVKDEYADLAGVVAGLFAGYGAAKTRLSPEQQTLVEVLQGKDAPDAQGRTINALMETATRGGTENERVMASAALKRKFGIDHPPTPFESAEPPAEEAEPAAEPPTAEPAKPQPQFEQRTVVPADVKSDAIFHDKAGRVFKVADVSPTGQVIYHGEDGNERVANSPEQFAKRMKGVVTVPTAQPADEAPPVTTAPEQAPATATAAPETLSAFDQVQPDATPPPQTPINTASNPVEATSVPPPTEVPSQPLTEQGTGNALHVDKLVKAAEGEAPAPVTEATPVAAEGPGAPAETPAPATETPAEATAVAPPAPPEESHLPYRQTAAESGLDPADHRAEVKDALARGEEVPDHVLAEYPDLSTQNSPSNEDGKEEVPVKWDAPGPAKDLTAAIEKAKASGDEDGQKWLEKIQGTAGRRQVEPADMDRVQEILRGKPEAAPSKENHELSRAEFVGNGEFGGSSLSRLKPGELVNLAQRNNVPFRSYKAKPTRENRNKLERAIMHEGAVRDAVSAGKNVPAEVLAEYPHLQTGAPGPRGAVKKAAGSAKLPSQAGQAPAIVDFIGWLDKKLGKDKAAKANYSGLGADEGEPEVHRIYNRRAASKSTFAPGGNLSQVRLGSLPAWRALVKMASADSLSRATMRVAELQIHEALKNAPIGFEDLIKYYSESRLRGIRDRWHDFATQAEDMNGVELEQSFSDAFMNLLDAIQNKRGIPINVKQTAMAIASRKDWDTLRDFLSDTFTDAASLVSRIMDDKEFEKIKDLVANDIQVARADNIYGRSVESLMSEYHAEHEGVFSNALGPADRYVPLIGNKPPEVLGGEKSKARNLYARASKAFKDPPNIQNVMATGISPHGYDTSIQALEQGLMKSVRASSKHQAIQALEQAGLIKRYTGQTPKVFEFQGKHYVAEKYEIQSARPMVTIQDGVKKVIHLPAHNVVMPRWVHDEVKHVLDAKGQQAEAEVMKEILRIMDIGNRIAVTGPSLAVIDSYNILNTVTANTPALGKSMGMKALSTPLTKRLTAALLIAREIDPMSVEAMDQIIEMAKIGAIPTKFASKTWSKRVAAMTGAEMAGKFDSSPWLYGPGGVDIRGRLQMFRIAKEMYPDAKPEELHDFINQIGTYVPGLQSTIERWLKYTGIAPFYTRGAQMMINGLNSLTGTGPLRKPPAGASTAAQAAWRAKALLTGSAVTLIALWLITSKLAGMRRTGLLTSELPHDLMPDEVRNSKIGHQLGWDKPGALSMDFAAFNPMVARGLRSTGGLAAIDTMMHGGAWWQAIEYGAAQSLSTVTQPVMGPLPRAAWVGLTGTQPYLTAERDRRGGVGPQFFPAIPAKHSGLKSFGERAAAAALSANAMASQLGQATGFDSPTGQDGGRYLEMVLNIAVPGINPKPVNEFSKNKMLYQQRSGTK